MNLRAVAAPDRDRVLALADRETLWRCGLGRSPADDVGAAFETGPAISRLLESNGAVTGFAQVAATTPGVGHFSAIASERRAFLALVDWACAAVSASTLRTSVALTGAARALSRGARGACPSREKDVLTSRGFTPYLTQRTMVLTRGLSVSPVLPAACRFADFEVRWLQPLLATYDAAWPAAEVDLGEAERSFREADGLVLAMDRERVAGYALWERVDEVGVIHEVAVHPDYRRRGVGSALTRSAIERLRPVTSRIELLVVDPNPAHLMYKRLGFEVAEEVEFLSVSPNERCAPYAAGSGCA